MRNIFASLLIELVNYGILITEEDEEETRDLGASNKHCDFFDG